MRKGKDAKGERWEERFQGKGSGEGFWGGSIWLDGIEVGWRGEFTEVDR